MRMDYDAIFSPNRGPLEYLPGHDPNPPLDQLFDTLYELRINSTGSMERLTGDPWVPADLSLAMIGYLTNYLT